MAKVRKDNKGRNLRPGETQRADGSYMYVYKLGTKKKYLYDSDLASLRVKEKQINKDKDDGDRCCGRGCRSWIFWSRTVHTL